MKKSLMSFGFTLAIILLTVVGCFLAETPRDRESDWGYIGSGMRYAPKKIDWTHQHAASVFCPAEEIGFFRLDSGGEINSDDYIPIISLDPVLSDAGVSVKNEHLQEKIKNPLLSPQVVWGFPVEFICHIDGDFKGRLYVTLKHKITGENLFEPRYATDIHLIVPLK